MKTTIILSFLSLCFASAFAQGYKSKDVSFKNDSITVSGTLTLPRDVKRAPVAIIVSGTGKQDRDGTMAGQKLFLQIADYLSSRGVAVLRCDDRGTGKTTGHYEWATTNDFADDALAAVRFLRKRKDVDTSRIGLIGHSEGGAVMSIAASKAHDVRFMVSLSGLCDTGLHSLIEQNAALVRLYSLPDYDVKRYDTVNELMFRVAYKYADSDSLKSKLFEAYGAWAKMDSIYFSTLGVKYDHFRFPIYMYAMQATTPWYRFFVRYDPARYLKDVRCPVLAINGDKDVMVCADTNLANWKRLMPQDVRVDTVKVKGLNHLLLPCKKGTPDEYAQIKSGIPESVLQRVLEFIRKQ